MPDIPEPDGHGWIKRADGGLDLNWIRGQVAPDAVLELLACQCKRTCVPDDCPCMVNDFICTYMCRLQICENQKVEDETFENDSDCSDVDCDTDEDREGEGQLVFDTCTKLNAMTCLLCSCFTCSAGNRHRVQ